MGLIGPGETAEVVVRHDDFLTQEEYVDGAQRNRWREATRDLEVVLSVTVTGSSSSSAEAVAHRVTVRHCCPAPPAPLPANRRSAAASPRDDVAASDNQSNHLHRSDLASFGSSEVRDLCGGL
jgi:hypothetical protein